MVGFVLFFHDLLRINWSNELQMESLAKRYDERFKAGGEVNSRLVAEEAAFRDIQVYLLWQ